MSSITKFDTSHEDIIHDIAYDFYGKRLVTCSSDQRLKVWDFVERDDAAVWELNDSWKAHDSSILKAIWAHPEYGQVIASCSLDRLVKIWEEQPIEPKMSQKRWAERFRLVESRGAVLDIAFSPIAGALRLATCSADGIVRIYEALEPTNLTQWSQMEEFEIALRDNDQPLPPHPPLPEPPTSAPQNTNSTSSSSSSIASHGLSNTEGATGPFPVMTPTANPVNPAVQNISPSSQGTIPTTTVPPSANVLHGPGDADSGYCIDWCPNRTTTAMMVVGLGKEIGARIFRHDGHSRWYPGEFLPGHEQEVHDVSWAPSMARSYQLIATASKDHYVRIFKLTEPQNNAASTPRYGQFSPAANAKQRNSQRHMQIELVAAFNDHHAEVWRVEWNITGTILSSSGDDGKLRLWKAGSDGVWRQMAAISANHHPASLS
ncbi:nucleoporin seh1 [Lichtheimia corymbifera JMRC:FSU:9682]|uniref:Nucleoporin seh1 n=1 Tax=Lichtheimia corymbifera JMRC:FSU:9682 TaxID=1263082 RepID=A0A068RHG7_9FUNG|nr:nucleoporin seh1 [Lichtheimia corymbifera JMRC:FSU:9682]